MKKTFLTIVVMACFISQMDAQVRFGIKGGLNFDNPKVDKLSSVEGSSGWHVGAMLQIMVPVIGLGVQPEALYTVKNVEVVGKKSGIGYFEVPVNLRYDINLLLLRPYITVGPYFGFVVNTSGEIKKDYIQENDWGIGVGGGLEIWKLYTGLRYSMGMKNIGKDGFEMKNRTFSVSIGYLF